MAYKVNEDQCVNCGACEADCPVGAISENPCISCGSCASSCPAEAISE